MDDPRAALTGWAFADRPELVDVVLEALAATPVAPRPGEGESAGLVRLGALGGRLADARGAWARARYPAEPLDVDIAAAWTRWGRGNPFSDQRRWLALLDKPVTGAFRQALSARPLPPDVVGRAIGDLRDALFYQLLGGGGRVSGFAELAAFVLETVPGGPVVPLVTALSGGGRATVAGCVSRRGHWPKTLERVLPNVPGARERAIVLQAVADADAVAWTELHTALRLLESWGSEVGDEDRDWAVVQQNLGRSRGRLRAVVAMEPPAALAARLVGVEGLAERTRAAARRWAWGWAWEALARGFAFDLDQPVIRACRAEPGAEPLDADELAALETWFLLAVVRGRGATVRRWSLDGSGDSDGTWGRLLLELPEGLRDPDGGYGRVRAALAEGWAERLVATAPLVRAIAELAVGRTLKDQFWRCVGPAWNEAVAKPRAGFPTFVAHAREWLQGPEMTAAMHGREERR